MLKTDYDFLIIGQGLAGSLLSHFLIERGQRVLVLDNNHSNSASKVAAGIINPITGHRLNITERFHDYSPVALAFYRRLEQKLKVNLVRQIEQTRLLKNPGQSAYCQQRRNEAAYEGMLFDTHSNAFTNVEHGFIGVSHTAIVEAKALLTATRVWLENLSSYQNTKVDYTSLQTTTSGVTLNGYSGKKLIFCEGYQATNNPWLKQLPFKVAKGEILTLGLTQSQNEMLNWGHWLVPDSATKTAKLGANFIWNDLSLTPSKTVKEQLLTSLTKNTNLAVRVLSHEAGIRPTTVQRKPFVGPLSNLKNAFCFNGLGSKGCLIAPHYASLLTQHLLHDQPLPDEVSKWL